MRTKSSTKGDTIPVQNQVQNPSSVNPTKWNLEEEIARVTKKRISLGVDLNASKPNLTTSSVALPIALPVALPISSPPSSTSFTVSPTFNIGILLGSSRPTSTPLLTPANSQLSPPTTLTIPPVTCSPLIEMAARASRGVPISCWGESFFIKLGNQIGTTVFIEYDTCKGKRLDRGKIQVILPQAWAKDVQINITMEEKIFTVHIEIDPKPVSFRWLVQLLGFSDFHSNSLLGGLPEKEKKDWPNSSVLILEIRSLTVEVDRILINGSSSRSKSNRHCHHKRSMRKFEKFSEVNCFSSKQSRSRNDECGRGKVEVNKGKKLWVRQSELKRLPTFYGNAKISIRNKKGNLANLSWQDTSSSPSLESERSRGYRCENSCKNHEAKEMSKERRFNEIPSHENKEIQGSRDLANGRWNLEEEVAKIIETGKSLGFDFNNGEDEVAVFMAMREEEDADKSRTQKASSNSRLKLKMSPKSPKSKTTTQCMDTRGKSNTEFRNDINEILARHVSSFDQVNAAIKTVLAELKSLTPFQALNTNQTTTYSNETT
ncbi:hypothetical protein LWI28_017996 [Acer negundo]|uniref:Uncharacterized protein n=1 Tax=Acer negundo TaxID=4023 RepID=A0AAD5NX35_ACENE|nr:hypothetical protein LWI28_017996 [Acer negundo]